MTPRVTLGLVLVWLCGPPAADAAQSETAAGAAVDRPLIAHWTFDEPAGLEFRDASGQGNDAAPAAGFSGQLRRVPGLFGGGLQFSGQHKLQIPQRPALENIEQIAFSAWVLPTELPSYREIFRKEDGEQRVLFSFQHDGTILSLGLNIDGYVECDARIDPAEVLDGGWHHCAATYDGRTMRVYLDGSEVGSLERIGRIRAGGSAPGCIGSSNGGENFQGLMDDLRIYAQALTPQEIAGLYREGLDAQARRDRELNAQLNTVYAEQGSFADTLAACRSRLRQQQQPLHPQLASVVLARLKAAFPAEYRKYVQWTGATPAEYLLAADNQSHVRAAERLLELLLEYRPLTEEQWKRQPPERSAAWREAGRFRQRLEQLQSLGAAGADSPDWIQLVLDVGPRVQFRPAVSEAVAPYVPPHTPSLRELSAEEAQQALERDWLHQAAGRPSPQRIRDEIRWARELAERLGQQFPQLDFAQPLAKLADLDDQAVTRTSDDPPLYFAVRQIKRAIQLANPLIDFDRVLFVDMPFPQGSEWPHETRHRLGYMAVPGGRLLILEGLSPAGRLRQLMPQPPLHGSFWRPDLSFDAQRVVFCFKPHNEKSFHLYEINCDGSGLVQLTDGPYDDLDPIYLPGERQIMFSTTRAHTYVRCMPPTNAFVLARCDRDGRNVYLISRNNEPDYLPSVMSDGRVIYTRWEYTDKPLWRAQGLWTVNPDGTQVHTFWGNQSVWPDLLKDARSIPGSRRVMFTGSAHHNWFSGSVGIIDPGQGFNFPDGLTKVTADVSWPESGDGPVDPVESPRYHASGQYAAYYSPYPLSEHDFLVSANRGGKFVLYLMDVDGNRELIYEGAHHIFHAQPVRPRPVPPVLADRVAWPTREQRLSPAGGVLYSSNVYQGAPPELQGRARYLRVLHIEPKTYTYWHKRPYISTGPVVSMVQSEGVKRVLGTVPIEADGSVAFEAPSGMPLHFQLLDENFLALQTMRSFTGVMPGEQRGCLGCHESHSRTPVPEGGSLALSRQPSTITPPPWGEDTVSYGRYVQPVLDQYCNRCHAGEGEARDVLDLSRRPGFLMFDEPYVTLTGRPSWGQPYQAPENPPPGWGIAGMLMVEGYDQRDPRGYQTPPPLSALSYRSRLIERAASGQHHDVRVDPISLQRLIAWVDAMCPYLGDEEVREIPDPEFQGVDWLSIRPRIHTAPRIVRPGPVE